MANPIKAGIIGCGDVLSAYMSLGETLRCRGLVEFVAAAATTEKKRSAAAEHGIGTFTTDYHDILNDAGIDLVLVLSPAQTHARIVRDALQAGKHVLTEKPFATSLDDAADIVALAAHSPGYLVCAPFVVLSPTFQTIWRLVERGDVGKISLARGRYGWTGPWWSEWFYQEGGGPLSDFAIYNLTTLTALLGPASRVTAFANTAVGRREVGGRSVEVEVEDNAHVLIEFTSGALGVVTTGFTMQRYRSPAIELYGSDGTVQLLGDDWAPQGFELWRNDVGAWEIFYETDPFWPWTDGLRHAIECIERRTPPVCTPEHAFHVLEIVIRARQAAQDGIARVIESRFTPPKFPSRPSETVAAHLVHDPRGRRH